MTRSAALLAAAVLVNLALYLLMENMISRDRVRVISGFDAQAVDFVRTPIEEQTRTKDRRRRPPPKPQEIKRPRADVENIANRAAALPSDMQSYAINSLLGDGAGIALGQRLVEGSGAVMETMLASDLTPISVIPPEYPISARQRGIEGWVDVIFFITEQGLVSEPEVIGAEPSGIFERAALSAVGRWRFRPLMRAGKPVMARGQYRIHFNLDDD